MVRIGYPILLSLIPISLFPILLLLLAGKTEQEPPGKVDLRDHFLISAVLWGTMLTVVTYGLGAFHLITRFSMGLVWGLALIVLFTVGLRTGWLPQGWVRAKRQVQKVNLSAGLKVVIAVVLIYAVILFAIAWVSPPNTNDSLRYHMSRVMHWQQNRSLTHYNTPISSQLWMAPWSEMAILNFVVLSGSDRLANLVQWLAMIGSLLGVATIAKKLGAGPAGQVFAGVYALTLPMAILQSTSTQNDYTTAFWVVCLAALLLRLHQDGPDRLTLWVTGLSIGLGILTKGTFYAYAIPFVAVWMVTQLWSKSWRRLFSTAAVFSICVLLLNGTLWWQNSRVFGSPLGEPGQVRHIANQSYTPGAILSNLIRNVTHHLGTPYGIINGNLQNVVEFVHNTLGLDANDRATTLDTYKIKRYLTEDRAGNPWHLLSIPTLIVTGWLFQKNTPAKFRIFGNRDEAQYVVVLILAFTLFSILYKWQSTGSRLQLPWFILLAAWAGVLVGRLNQPRIQAVFFSFFILIGLPFVLNNPSRPFLPFRGDPLTIWNTPRQVVLFRNSPEVLPGYQSLAEAFRTVDCDRVGLRIDSSDPEYVLWALLAREDHPVRFRHLFPEPPITTNPADDFQPCAVVCTFCTADTLAGLPLDSSHHGGIRLYLEPNLRPK